MNRSPSRFHARVAAACVACAALIAPRATAQDAVGDIARLWKDPVFQKQFVAGYGVHSELEPRVTPEEVAILEKVRPLMAEDLPRAEKLLVDSIQRDSSAMLDLTLGGVFFQQEKTTEALYAMRAAVRKFPSFRRAWRNLGLIYARNANYEAAIEAFTRMIELGGGDGFAYGLLGYAYSSLQDYQAAEAAFRNALLLQPESTEWRLGLTSAVYKQDKFEDACALLDVLIARFPEKGEFWLLQAQAFLNRGRPLQAAQNLEALSALGLATLDSLQMLGDVYVSEGLSDLAAEAYVRAIDLDPKQPLARPLRAAEVLASRGAFRQARSVTSHLRSVCGDRLEAADRKSLLKVESRLSMAEGIGGAEMAAVLEELLQSDPLDGETLMLLGQYHSRMNEPDRAILYYERAASLEAFEPTAKVRHAQVLVAMGRHADALPLLRRAQELKARDDVARYLEQVERLAKARR